MKYFPTIIRNRINRRKLLVKMVNPKSLFRDLKKLISAVAACHELFILMCFVGQVVRYIAIHGLICPFPSKVTPIQLPILSVLLIENIMLAYYIPPQVSVPAVCDGLAELPP